MKNIALHKLYLLTFFFSISTVALFGQTQTGDWLAESYLVSVNGTDVELTSNIAKEGSSLTWEQLGYNNTDTITLAITSMTGTWDNEAQIGELSYTMSSSDVSSASLSVIGTIEGITIGLVIYDANNNLSDSYTFTIDTFTNN